MKVIGGGGPDTKAFPRAVQQLQFLPRVGMPYDSHVISFLRH